MGGQLDTGGSVPGPLPDGEHTVADVEQAVHEHFGEKAEPVRDRLVRYLQTPEACGFIRMMKKAEPEAAPGGNTSEDVL